MWTVQVPGACSRPKLPPEIQEAGRVCSQRPGPLGIWRHFQWHRRPRNGAETDIPFLRGEEVSGKTNL